jgi:hypothetical protein
MEDTVDRTTDPNAKKPLFPRAKPKPAPGPEPAVAEKPLTDKDKGKLVRMIVNYSSQDKISKAMDALKEQGLGENEVKITLEE